MGRSIVGYVSTRTESVGHTEAFHCSQTALGTTLHVADPIYYMSSYPDSAKRLVLILNED